MSSETSSSDDESSDDSAPAKKSVRWTEATKFVEEVSATTLALDQEVSAESSQDDNKKLQVINRVNGRQGVDSFLDVDLLPYYNKRDELDYETVVKTLANKFAIELTAPAHHRLFEPASIVDDLRFQVAVTDEVEQLIESLKAYRRAPMKKERQFKPDLPSAFNDLDGDPNGEEVITSINEDIFYELIFVRSKQRAPKKDQIELSTLDAFELIDSEDSVWKLITSIPGRVRIQSYDGHRLILRYLWSTVEVHIRFGPLNDADTDRAIKGVDLFRILDIDAHMADSRLRLAGKEDAPLLDYDPLPWPFQRDEEVAILVAAASPLNYDFKLHVGGMPYGAITTFDQLMELLWGLNESAKIGRELVYQLLLIRATEYCRLAIDQQGMLQINLDLWRDGRAGTIVIDFDTWLYPYTCYSLHNASRLPLESVPSRRHDMHLLRYLKLLRNSIISEDDSLPLDDDLAELGKTFDERNFRIQSYKHDRLVVRFLWSMVEFSIDIETNGEDEDNNLKLKVSDCLILVDEDTRLQEIRWVLLGKLDPPLLEGDEKIWVFKEEEEVTLLAIACDCVLRQFDDRSEEHLQAEDLPSLLNKLSALVQPHQTMCIDLLRVLTTNYCQLVPRFDEEGHHQVQIFLDFLGNKQADLIRIAITLDPLQYPNLSQLKLVEFPPDASSYLADRLEGVNLMEAIEVVKSYLAADEDAETVPPSSPLPPEH